MIEVLQFIFPGFWTFVGCWISLGITASAVVGLARAIMRVPVTHIHNYNGTKT